MPDRKSFELYVQTAAWTGGIAAAATGGILLALINPDLPRTIATWLPRIGIALLVALIGSGYLQFHAIAVLNAKERSDATSAEKSGKYLAASQFVMFSAIGLAALLLCIALFEFQPEPKPPGPWTVAGANTSATETLVILTRANSDKIRVLTRNSTDKTWVATDATATPPATKPPDSFPPKTATK